jgi:hypothetical protein
VIFFNVDLAPWPDLSVVLTPNSSISRIASRVDRCRPFLSDVQTLINGSNDFAVKLHLVLRGSTRGVPRSGRRDALGRALSANARRFLGRNIPPIDLPWKQSQAVEQMSPKNLPERLQREDAVHPDALWSLLLGQRFNIIHRGLRGVAHELVVAGFCENRHSKMEKRSGLLLLGCEL